MKGKLFLTISFFLLWSTPSLIQYGKYNPIDLDLKASLICLGLMVVLVVLAILGHTVIQEDKPMPDKSHFSKFR